MGSQINDLVAMHDVQTLYELMSEQDDWMMQLDAAEGLVKLGDRRGLDFLRSALQSDDRDANDVAREILSSPGLQRNISDLTAEDERALQAKRQEAIKRLKAGGRAFEYQMVFIPTGELLGEDPLSEGYDVPLLTELGLEGWEVVSLVARRLHDVPGRSGALSLGGMLDSSEQNVGGAYFLLKRKLSEADTANL